MKRKLCALGLALLLGLTACGENAPPQDGAPPASPSSTPAAPAQPEQPGDPFSGTYWTAVRREATNDYTGAVESSALPTENWWADLWLCEDGSAQYREVLNCFYNADIHGGQWWRGKDNTLRLTSSDPDAYLPDIDGQLENGQLVLEYFGQRFYLEQAEPPAPGGELCAADAQGTWKLERILNDGTETDARSKGLAACLHLDERWSDWSSGYQPTATLYTAEKLDDHVPKYERYEDLDLEVVDTPAIEGLSNQCWSLRLFSGETEFLVTMTDMDTLCLQDESGTVGIYGRTASLLPETVTTPLRDLSFDALLFYWPDPDAETVAALDFIPVTELEPGGTNRILLVSRWVDLQIQVHSGNPQLQDTGASWWQTDQILYEGELDADEPMWLSLNFPEGTAELCLFFKLPGSEVWSTWQLTQQGSYHVDGYTSFIAS